MSVVLVVFCRRPSLHAGKQRLATAIGVERAQRVAQALLACALEDATVWPGPVVIAPADACDREWARQLCGRWDVLPQSEGGFGERLEALDRELRGYGARSIVFIGSDAPALNEDDYATARAALADHDIVLGPAADGGVTLMGARLPWPTLPDLPWGEANLFEALSDRCRARSLSVALLRPGFDVDTVADLERVLVQLRQDARPARRELHALLVTLGVGCAA